MTRNFANNGRGLFNYLWTYGHLPYSEDEKARLESEWKEATMSKVGIKYTEDALFEWGDYIEHLADKLSYTNQQKRTKYLAGFPTAFDVMIVPERARGALGSYLFPANYPAHHPQAGTPHPHAMEPDIHATSLAFYSEWSRMIKNGMIKAAPRGMAYSVEEDAMHEDDADVEHARVARDRITPSMVCLICGGLGHTGTVDGLGQCLTAKLGFRIPRSDLESITYPQGYSRPRFSNRSSNRSSTSNRSHPYRDSNPTRARIANTYEDEHDDFRADVPNPDPSSSSNPQAVSQVDLGWDTVPATLLSELVEARQAEDLNRALAQLAALRAPPRERGNRRQPPAPRRARRSTVMNPPLATAPPPGEALQNLDADADDEAALAVDFEGVDF